MCHEAAHITDAILPSVPVQQWVEPQLREAGDLDGALGRAERSGVATIDAGPQSGCSGWRSARPASRVARSSQPVAGEGHEPLAAPRRFHAHLGCTDFDLGPVEIENGGPTRAGARELAHRRPPGGVLVEAQVAAVLDP